jgi:trehalose synthase
MIRIIETALDHSIADYAAEVELCHAALGLQEEAREAVGRLTGRTVWMVSSTAAGGGVAEMLPHLIGLLRELGVDARWAVIENDEAAFFGLTKRIHNLLHGADVPALNEEDRALYERISGDLAAALQRSVRPGDILVVHDPQPLAAGALVARAVGIPAIWCCHIGTDELTSTARAAWDFLRPWAQHYDRAIFTLPEYVPDYLRDRAEIITPAIDPLSLKNRRLDAREVASFLAAASAIPTGHPTLPTPLTQPARRLQPDGELGAVTMPDDLGLLFRPVLLQVSRWDRLKGWLPLLHGFARLKAHKDRGSAGETIAHARLVLAGPEPKSVRDDPEGQGVYRELAASWQALDPAVQRDIAVLVLPAEPRSNALIVNALQNCATIVVQNSLREGFGLTVTEAMWKRRVVVGTTAAGIRAQLRADVDGLLIPAPEDPAAVATTLAAALGQPERWSGWGRNAQGRVADNYLVFGQIERWLGTLSTLALKREASTAAN